MDAVFVAAHSCGEARELWRCGKLVGEDAWRAIARWEQRNAVEQGGKEGGGVSILILREELESQTEFIGHHPMVGASWAELLGSFSGPQCTCICKNGKLTRRKAAHGRSRQGAERMSQVSSSFVVVTHVDLRASCNARIGDTQLMGVCQQNFTAMHGEPCTRFVFGAKRRPRRPADRTLLVCVTLRTQHRTHSVVGARHIAADMHASRITEACAQGKARRTRAQLVMLLRSRSGCGIASWMTQQGLEVMGTARVTCAARGGQHSHTKASL